MDRLEQPGAPTSAEQWPGWFAPLGFVLAGALSLLLGGMLAAISGASTDTPAFTLVSTIGMDAALVLVAVGLASLYRRPTPADFGLRPSRLRLAAAAFAIGAIAFYGLSAAYAAVFSPDGEQDVVQSLGADESLGLLIGAGLLVVLIAPYAEELFFRGFFYRALRNRLGVAGATITVGLVFGAIHYSGPDTLPLLPVLALFGVVLCAVYQRTGSLYPAIALHALNNAIALAVATGERDGAIVAATFGLVAIGSCVVVPGLQRARFVRPGLRVAEVSAGRGG